MLTETTDYAKLCRDFRWDIPERLNLASVCCDRHADGSGRLALIYVDEDGAATRTSFDEVAEMSRRFANVLKADGLVRGDRVAVFLSQSLELPIAHTAAFRSGQISIPLFALCAGISPGEFRRQGGYHRRGRLGEAGKDPRPASRSCKCLRHRRPCAGRHQIVLVGDQRGLSRFFDRRHLMRRPRFDHLHFGHHG
jgi:acetyl-CoA synthetase